MKIVLYGVLILLEYGLAKIVWLLMNSMVFNGLAPVMGVIISLLFVGAMLSLWKWGKSQING